MNNPIQAAAAARQFQIGGEFLSAAPYGTGHINDTYCANFSQAGVMERFILQRINTSIFRDPVALMENVQRVTAHLAAQHEGLPDRGRRVLTVIPARDGRPLHQDAEGDAWRVYRFINRARTFESVANVEQAYQAAQAFGAFQKRLADLPSPRLHDTIPGFHDTPSRFRVFEQAVAQDVAARATLARAEIDFAFARRSHASVLLDAKLPERVTHNDTKLNNVLFDADSGEGLCVVDLDTVMPGLAPYDFGDMVRTATTGVDEDEQDLSKVAMRFTMFEALVRGYLSTAGGFLSIEEKRHLAVAGKVITFEQGIRFLTDYLAGDSYYKVHREGHNLERCRTQFKLVESIEQQEAEMNLLINRLIDEAST